MTISQRIWLERRYTQMNEDKDKHIQKQNMDHFHWLVKDIPKVNHRLNFYVTLYMSLVCANLNHSVAYVT